MQGFQLTQTFNGRGDRDRGSNNAVCQQRCPAYDGRDDKPSSLPSYQCIQGESAALTAVIGPQYQPHIFQRGLQGKCPDDTGKAANDEELIYRSVFYDGIEYVKRRGSDISVNNAQRN